MILSRKIKKSQNNKKKAHKGSKPEKESLLFDGLLRSSPQRNCTIAMMNHNPKQKNISREFKKVEKLIHGDGLGKITGNIGIDATQQGEFICDNLQWQHSQKSCERAVVWNF